MPSIHDASNNLLARLTEADRFNEEQKAKSPGMISQFEADGLMYSIVHNPACIFVIAGKESRINQEFFTVYVQNASIADPDECLVTTESLDTLIEAVMFIRNHIEQRVMQAFIPGLTMKSEFFLKEGEAK